MGGWRKLFVGTLFTLFAAVAILASALAWRLSLGPIPLPSLTQRFEEALSSIAPGLVAHVEHTEIAWLHHLPELRVVGVKLERRDGKLLISVPSLGVRPSLRAFAHGRLAVERLRVEGVHVSLVRDESGSLLLGSGDGGEVPLDVSALGSTGDGSDAVFLKRIRIRDTDIRLEDRAAGGRWRLDDARLDITPSGGGFELDAAARLHMTSTSSTIVRVVDLPFSAKGGVQVGQDAAIGDATFQIKAKDGSVVPAGPPGPLIALRSLVSEGSLSISSRRLELRTLRAAIGSAELDSTVSVSIDGIAQGLKLEGVLRSLPVAELERLWPPSAAAATHDWIVQNIHDGTVSRCRFAIHIPGAEAAARPLAANAVDLAFDFEGLTVDYLRELTPVEQTRGSATLDAERFEARVTGGEIGRLHLGGGQVEIQFRGGPPWLKVAADVTGPTEDVLGVLERPPLEIPQAIGIPSSNVTGKSVNHVEIELPLKHGLQRSDVVVRASGDLHETTVADLLGLGVEGGELKVRVEGRRVDVEGEAGLTGLPVAVERGRVEVAFAPDASGAADQLTVSLDGKDLRAKGKATLEGRALTNLEIERLQLAGSDLTAAITRQGDGFRASVDGSVLDLDPLLHGTGSGSQLAKRIRVPYDVDFRIQRVKVGKGVELSNAQGTGHGDGGRLTTLHTTGATANAGAIRIDLVERDSVKHLDIASDQGGSLLKALGIFEDAEGGKAVLAATVDDRNPKARIEGRLDVNDFRVTRAPVLARVLSVGSLDGIASLLQGEGLASSRARVPFVWSAGTVELHDARAIGAIGLSADGRLDRTARTIELRGNLFPAHTLNSALGKIPFIGEFLVGGEDQGIFGIAFRVSGNLDKPDVQVNPLTALAPVVLRKMFVDPFKHEDGEEHSETQP